MYVDPVFIGRDFKLDPKLCFVLMPLHDPFTSIFEHHIKPVATKCDLVARKADDITSNKPIMEDVWKYINQARIVIADLTDSNPNVFYELGIAHTLGKEVIMIAQHVQKLPFDVGHVRYIQYTYPSQVAAFEERLEDTIKQVMRDSTVEIRLLDGKKEQAASPESPLTTRNQRLNALTEYARQWVKNNYVRLVSSKSDVYQVSEWDIYESINNEIKIEAVRRWTPSGETTKNYAQAVMLTIKAEFKDPIEAEVKKRNEELEQQRKEKALKRRLIRETWLALETRSRLNVKGTTYMDALIKTGKFSQQEAAQELASLIQLSTIRQVRGDYYERVREFYDSPYYGGYG